MEKEKIREGQLPYHGSPGVLPLRVLPSGALCKWYVSPLPQMVQCMVGSLVFLVCLVVCLPVARNCTEGPSIQAIAMAASKSGMPTPDVQELASLGNHGQNPNHIAHLLQSKFCESTDIDLPMPYFVDTPVQLRTADGLCVTQKKIGMFLPHEWFYWLCGQDVAISGLHKLGQFWEEHSPKDPQLKNNPIQVTQQQNTCVNDSLCIRTSNLL